MSTVVVIGAGLGGLATAARLAVKGHAVTVLEASGRVGGKLHTYRRDGFAFDTGPSLFTLPAVYRDLFLKTGGPFEEAVDLQPLDPAFHLHFADGSDVVMPGVDPARCADALDDALGGSAGEEWRALMERAGRMWRITREPFLQSPLPDWRTLMSLARSPADVRTVAPFTTLRQLGSQYLSDPRLRAMLDRYATYSGSDPRKAPAVFATVPYIEQAFGAWHLGGGVGTLADALEQRCRERGVDIRLHQDVARIRLRDGRACGVELVDDTVVDADIVVANADAGTVYGTLLEGDPRAARMARDIARAPHSVAGFVMLLAVRGRTPGIEHHNVWFPQDYDAEFDAIFGRESRPVPDPTIYACVPADPLMRPDEDHEPWFILINAPRQGVGERGAVDWTAPGVADGYADHILGLLAARGVDLRERTLWRELRTPADFARDVRAPHGVIYGASSNGPRAAFQRPDNRSPIPGLFLVGGSAHPGGGLPLVGMGAETTAALIGRADGLPGGAGGS